MRLNYAESLTQKSSKQFLRSGDTHARLSELDVPIFYTNTLVSLRKMPSRKTEKLYYNVSTQIIKHKTNYHV